jgi:hypothetical protein
MDKAALTISSSRDGGNRDFSSSRDGVNRDFSSSRDGVNRDFSSSRDGVNRDFSSSRDGGEGSSYRPRNEETRKRNRPLTIGEQLGKIAESDAWPALPQLFRRVWKASTTTAMHLEDEMWGQMV